MKAVAISLDGVLRKPLDSFAQDYGGKMLYVALSTQFRTVVLGSDDPVADENFLLTNGYFGHVKVEPERMSDSARLTERRRMQLNRLRKEGFQFEFVVVPDPEMAQMIYRTGIPVLLYLHPLYSAEAFRPDYTGEVRPWALLDAEVDYQRSTRAQELKKAVEHV
jgi:hypothetical protein